MKALWSRKGQALVIVAFGIIALMGAAGLAIDVGSWFVTAQHLQSTADAAALAAASDLPNNTAQAVTDAVTTAQKNGFTITSNDVSFSNGNWNVTVSVPGVAPTYFTRVFGMNGVPETRMATATPLYSPNDAVYSQSGSVLITMKGSGVTINGNVHSNAGSPYINQPYCSACISGVVTGPPDRQIPSPTWASLFSNGPTIVDENGDTDPAVATASSPADSTDGDSCTLPTVDINPGTVSSLDIPTSGTFIVVGNVVIEGNLNFPNLSIVAYGGNLTVGGTTGGTTYTENFNALMALDNQSTTLSSTQCQTATAEGNVTINGNVTLSAGAVWADSQALLEGNPTISVGSVTGNTVVLGGKVSITWNPKNGGIRGIPYLTP